MPLALASLQFGRLGRQIGNPLGLFADQWCNRRQERELSLISPLQRLQKSLGDKGLVPLFRKAEFYMQRRRAIW
jgi:hypothetical protein